MGSWADGSAGLHQSVLLFGAGGEFVEIFKDRALGLPPLNATLARRMMEQTRIFAALRGVRGRAPVDLDALAELLVRFSHLVIEQRWIQEIDINPLLVSGGEFLALDARVLLHEPGMLETDLPQLAIRPYPAQYISPWKLRDGAPVTIRPVRPEDEPLMIAFHRTLSAESVHFRYFGQIALVVERRHGSAAEIIGVGCLSTAHGLDEAEFALVVSDQWQGHGLGSRLLELLVQIGRAEKLSRLTAHILADNAAMQHVARKCGFELRRDEAEDAWKAGLRL